MNNIIKAARLAAHLHRNQIRKYTEKPYITHPARVAARLSYHPFTDEVHICAAFLHDSIEDVKEYSYEKCVEDMGKWVANLVLELTNPSKLCPELPRKDRKKLDLDHIAKISVPAKRIKLIDRTDNLNEMPLDNPEAMGFLKRVYLRESWDLYYVLKEYDNILADELLETLNRLEKIK